MDKFKTVLTLAKDQTSLGFGLVALLTAAGEHVFSSAVFSCPCNRLNVVYGLVFLLVPALALLTLGLILSKKTWKLVTGLCLRREQVCGSCGRLRALATVLFQISTVALVAPSTWIAVALLNGAYVECAMTGTNMTLFNRHLCEGPEQQKCEEELPTFPCGKQSGVSQNLRDQVLLTLKAESQVVGWLLIASIILSQLVLTCVARCCSPVSYLQLKFWRLYAKEESAALHQRTARHAQELATRNVDSFFSSARPQELHTPSSRDWEEVSRLYKYKSKGNLHYSTLHRFVENQSDHQDGSSSLMRNPTVKSTGSNCENPVVLGFVEEGQMSF